MSAPRYLSALVDTKQNSLEVRTQVFSHDGFGAFIERHAAITLASTVAPAGRLLDTVNDHEVLIRRLKKLHSRVRVRWQWFRQVEAQQKLEWVRTLDADELRPLLDTVLRSRFVVAAFLPEGLIEPHPSTDLELEMFEAFTSALVDFTATPPGLVTAGSSRAGAIRAVPIDERRAKSVAPVSATTENAEAKNRKLLLAARERMLAEVPCLRSEDLASAAESTTVNASQYAADQRETGKVFGIRQGAAWHYPAFQFDETGKPFVEMKSILQYLSPDLRGWDRLQWFLEPHEVLEGKTPLEVWTTDRSKVKEAASKERWDGRD